MEQNYGNQKYLLYLSLKMLILLLLCWNEVGKYLNRVPELSWYFKVLLFSGAGWMLRVRLWFRSDSCLSQVWSSAEEQPPRVLYPWRNQGRGLARVKRDWIIPQIRVLENSKQVPEALVQVKMSGYWIDVKYGGYTAAKAAKICSDWDRRSHISLQSITSLTWCMILPI